MLNFCTLFDSFYLSRGLAMYESLKKQCNDFHLYIFAFDDKAFDILNKFNLSHVTVISLADFEDDKLLAVKPTRSRAEYCWTCTPSTIAYVIDKFNVDNCTYIDADLYFYSSPKILIDEMGGKSVLITEHRYSKAYDRAKIAGIYCVQFVTFLNNAEGLTVLNWWKNACLDWCYDKYEDGKFGDQKYLDDWTTRFAGVHVLNHLGGGMAPWNVQQYELNTNNPFAYKFTNKKDLSTFDLVFYHFHYVRFYKGNTVDLGWFKLAPNKVKYIYKPYVLALEKQLNSIKKYDSTFDIPLKAYTFSSQEGIKDKVKFLIKYFTKYNMYLKHKL